MMMMMMMIRMMDDADADDDGTRVALAAFTPVMILRPADSETKTPWLCAPGHRSSIIDHRSSIIDHRSSS